jgi:hypothetical protein
MAFSNKSIFSIADEIFGKDSKKSLKLPDFLKAIHQKYMFKNSPEIKETEKSISFFTRNSSLVSKLYNKSKKK